MLALCCANVGNVGNACGDVESDEREIGEIHSEEVDKDVGKQEIKGEIDEKHSVEVDEG